MTTREYALIALCAILVWRWLAALSTIRALHHSALAREERHFAEVAAAQAQGEREKWIAELRNDAERD